MTSEIVILVPSQDLTMVFRLTLVTCVALFLVGCSRQPNTLSQDEQRNRHEQVATDAGSGSGTRKKPAWIASEPLGKIAALAGRNINDDIASRVDPKVDGWKSEVFSEAATRQLKHLCELLDDPGDITVEKLSPLVLDKVASGPLRPDNLVEVFHDSVFVILRLESDPTQLPDEVGIKHFSRQMSQLANSLSGYGPLHSKAKVVRVVMTETEATTLIHFSASRGRISQNADWECLWSLSSAVDMPKLAKIRLVRFEETRHEGPSEKLFSDVTGSVFAGQEEAMQRQWSLGIDYWRARFDKRLGISPSGDHGVAVGDVNSDGREDLYLCQTGGMPNRLLLQQPNGTVIDVAAEAGVDFLDSTSAALLIDLDNDGDQDLVLSMGRDALVLEKVDGNNGPNYVRRAVLQNEAIVLSLAAGDYDRDGDLDIYACGYYGSETSEDAPLILGRPIPYHDANNGGRNTLWRNDLIETGQERLAQDTWSFADVTEESGLEDNNHRFSFAASWEDYDNDGDLDLYVANDFGRNHLYQNSEGLFSDVAAEAGVEDISTGMSVTWGDYNNDGWMDVYVSNMFSSAGNRITYQRQFQEEASEEQLAQFRRHARGNTLFENAGNGTFRDVSEAAAVTMGRWAWSSLFMDINNDGTEDLVVGNGFITTEDTGDL